MKFTDSLMHAWNTFKAVRKDTDYYVDVGAGSNVQNYKDRARITYSEATFVKAIFNRIAVDCSSVSMRHVKMDAQTENETIINSGLQNCLSVEANRDQSNVSFIRDLVYSMLDEGVVAVVPIETDVNLVKENAFDVVTMRTGKITEWYAKHVKVRLYNEEEHSYEEIILEKSKVAIIENPFYEIVNSDNGLLKRLLKKMSMDDEMDELVSNGSIDVILQLPYKISTDAQKKIAEERITNLTAQLRNSRHGVAYSDATEKITQLNRPINDKLPAEVDRLMTRFYNQIGLTEGVLDGTANESVMRNYYTRTVDPIINTILAEFARKFLTKTARTQGHQLVSYRDPFALVPVSDLANIGDVFTRNAILTPNEVRRIIRYAPHSSEEADKLYNRNMPEGYETENQNEGLLE